MSRIKVALEYEPDTGNIYDQHNVIIATWAGLEQHEIIDGVSVTDICDLKRAGFEVDEIIEMKRKGVL